MPESAEPQSFREQRLAVKTAMATAKAVFPTFFVGRRDTIEGFKGNVPWAFSSVIEAASLAILPLDPLAGTIGYISGKAASLLYEFNASQTHAIDSHNINREPLAVRAIHQATRVLLPSIVTENINLGGDTFLNNLGGLASLSSCFAEVFAITAIMGGFSIAESLVGYFSFKALTLATGSLANRASRH